MKFKGQIDFKQFIRPSNNYCHYGFAQMFWLELVMNLLGYNSYRSKIARLKELKEFNQLESFYKNIGIDYHSPYLNELYVWLTHFKQDIQNLVHIAVDGKDIHIVIKSLTMIILNPLILSLINREFTLILLSMKINGLSNLCSKHWNN